MKSSIPLAAVSSIFHFNTTNIRSGAYSELNTGDPNTWPWISYKSSPHLSPYLNITHHSGVLSEGYLFYAPVETRKNGGYGPSGQGFIVNMDGHLVYAANDLSLESCDAWVSGITDFRVQIYENRSYLTYWNGCNTRDKHWGYRWGSVTFVDEEYQTFTLNPKLNIDTMDVATGGQIDMHEHQMTDRNTMVVTSYNNTNFDGISVADGLFFEIDIVTGEILFEWRALDHLDMTESHWDCTGAATCDWAHINSVQAVGDNYLISARHLFAIYLISGKDGSVIWKLDGLGNGTWNTVPSPFQWQHHARATNVTKDGMTVSLFNNNNYVDGPRDSQMQAQGLAFWIPMPPDPKKPPIVVKWLQTDEEPVFSGTQGSYQFDVGNGNGFIGYGLVPKAREYGPEGDIRWQAQFGYENEMMSYRAFKETWHGTPRSWDPVVAIERSSDSNQSSKVYVSWNGATDITGWAVYGGDETMKPIGIAMKMGFETNFDLNGVTCVQVGAVRANEIIRISNVACIEAEVVGLETTFDAQERQRASNKGQLVKLLSSFALIGLSLVTGYRAWLLYHQHYRQQPRPVLPEDQIGLLSTRDDDEDFDPTPMMDAE